MSDTHPHTSVVFEPNLDITALIIIQMSFKNDYKMKEGLPWQPESQVFLHITAEVENCTAHQTYDPAAE